MAVYGEEDIVGEIRCGNKKAFKKLFDDYYPILCVFSTQYVANQEVCKDIVQEAFVAYWERRRNFDDLLRVKGFLYAVTRNKCLNHLKHEQLDISGLEYEEVDSDFESSMIEQETYRLVRKAVEELPAQMRNVILYSMRGYKNHEIADKLQISAGTVQTLKKIAYRKLRETLKGINYIVLLYFCK